jgi:hypothetical protein
MPLPLFPVGKSPCSRTVEVAMSDNRSTATVLKALEGRMDKMEGVVGQLVQRQALADEKIPMLVHSIERLTARVEMLHDEALSDRRVNISVNEKILEILSKHGEKLDRLVDKMDARPCIHGECEVRDA